MAMRPPVGAPTLNRRTRILLIAAGLLVLLLLGGSRLISFYVDWLWFGEVGYRDVFTHDRLHPRPAVPARGAADRRGRRAVAVDRLPVPSGVRPGVRPRRPDRALPHGDHLAAAAVRDRHPGARRRDRRARGAGRLADRAAVPALHAVRGHRPRVRHRHQLLRLRAAVLPLGARAGCSSRSRSASSSRWSRTTCSAASGSPAAPGRSRRPRAPSWPCWPGCSCCSRPSPTTSTATSCCTPAATRRSPVPPTPT